MDRERQARVVAVMFSKDRALQLDAALRSFFLNCSDPHLVSLKVIYTGRNATFLEQYHELGRQYAGDARVDFIEQTDFRKDVFEAIGVPFSKWRRVLTNVIPKKRGISAATPFLLFLVDDIIFAANFRLSEIVAALNDHRNALGFTLLLGENINYCYPLELPIEFPDCEHVTDRLLKYHWPSAGTGLNYPLEVSGSVYRLKEMAGLLGRIDFTNPNTLEASMAAAANDYQHSHPYLLCYRQSVSFCNPLNKVQNTYNNKDGGKPAYSPGSLANMFAKGYRIDIAPYQNMVSDAVHQEVDLVFSNNER